MSEAYELSQLVNKVYTKAEIDDINKNNLQSINYGHAFNESNIAANKYIEIEIQRLQIYEMYEISLEGYDNNVGEPINTKIVFYDYIEVHDIFSETSLVTTNSNIKSAKVYLGENGNIFVSIEMNQIYFQLFRYTVFRGRYKNSTVDTKNDTLNMVQTLPTVRNNEVDIPIDRILHSGMETDWITPTLQNGWVRYHPTFWPTLQYKKMPDGTVHLRGLIKDGVIGQNIFVLPEGFRPSDDLIVIAQAAGGSVRIDIHDTGSVTIVAADYDPSSAIALWTSFANISFPT